MIVPVPRPPPQHIVTRPMDLSERSSSCRSVVISRAPVEPSGWPRAIAPPFTLTLSMSGSSSRRQAATTEANASLISIRSKSSIVIELRSRSFWVAGIGPVSMITGSTPTVVWSTIRARSEAERVGLLAGHQQHGGSAVRDLRRVAGGDLAVLLEGGLETGELFEARVGARALVGHVSVAIALEGTDPALEAPLLGGLRCELVGAQADLVELGAGDLPLVGDHLGRDALGDQVVLLHQLGGEGEAVLALDRHAVGEGDVAHVLDARADRDVMDAGGDEGGGEVHGLLGRAALTVNRGGRGLDRKAGLEPGVAADVHALLAELLDAAGDDVLDLGGIDAGAVDHLGVGLGEEVGGVGVFVVALLLVASADRGPGRFDDQDLAPAELPVATHHRPPSSHQEQASQEAYPNRLTGQSTTGWAAGCRR